MPQLTSLYAEDRKIVFWRGEQEGDDIKDVTEIAIPIEKVNELIAVCPPEDTGIGTIWGSRGVTLKGRDGREFTLTFTQIAALAAAPRVRELVAQRLAEGP